MSRLILLVASALVTGSAAAAAMTTSPAPSRVPRAAPTPASPPGTGVQAFSRERMVLDRLAFGARPGEVEKLRAMGVEAWIGRQLHPESIPDGDLERRIAGLEVPRMSTAELFAKYPNPAMLLAQSGQSRKQLLADKDGDKEQLKRELVREYRDKGYGRPREVYTQLATDRLLRATYSERQLQEVMVDFWSNHFNVYAKKNVLQWYLPAFDRDVIRPHALGKFRDLLLATAESPAMLYYLDNFQSVSPDANLAARMPARRQMKQKMPTGINENYARELMELHTLGVDGGYSQQDIREVARAFTGWTIADARGIGGARAMGGRAGGRLRQRLGVPEGVRSGEFYFNPVLHDSGTKTVLGRRIDGGGVRDGLAVIELLADHPSTAKFISRKLCEKFVSDSPDPALVARVAAAFTRSDGDIRATLAALFRDPAFLEPQNYRAKVKTPFELVASSLRALGAQSNGREVQLLLADLGQPLYGYQAPTGYSEMAADWVNSGALLKRMNFAVALAANRIPGTRVDLSALEGGAAARDARTQLDAGLQVLLGGQVSAQTRNQLLARLDQPLPEATLDEPMSDEDMGGNDGADGGRGRGPRVRLLAASGDPQRVQVAALILGSPEFQRQ
jgi:uncharacterized protein (DUF1800 family)